MKATMFSVTLDHERKWNYLFFDGFISALVENNLIDQEYIEAGIQILRAAQQAHAADDGQAAGNSSEGADAHRG